jgi:hypothetical protein
MGMDIYGRKPSSSKGEYLRLTQSGWTPVWSYVAELCQDLLTERDIQCGFSNDGHRISAAKAADIAQRLHEHLSVKAAPETFKPAYLSAGKKRARPNLEDRHSGEGSIARVAALDQKMAPKMRKALMEFAAFCAASGGFEVD